MSQTLYHGDCREVMKSLEPNSVDAVVCDPPYGLEFMGKDWDKLGGFRDPKKAKGDLSSRYHARMPERFVAGAQMQDWHEAWAIEALRVLKPGAHLLAFGGTRTHHRLMCAIEDAGFEIRDCVMWVYGSGFPKSKNVALAIDKGKGFSNRGHRIATANRRHPDGTIEPNGDSLPAYEGRSDAAKQWDGWGTALKPAWEPIIIARKPLEGTVAQNVLKYGTGALNIDLCRVTYGSSSDRASATPQGRCTSKNVAAIGAEPDAGRNLRRVEFNRPEQKGRWPANVILDDSGQVRSMFPTTTSGANPTRRGSPKFRNSYGTFEGQAKCEPARGVDSGSAARFFYSAKASRKERGEGNDHPTVKPIALMRYLCRLATPPGGIILDCFMGSGTTGRAALEEGFEFIGIEKDRKYFDIARKRIKPRTKTAAA